MGCAMSRKQGKVDAEKIYRRDLKRNQIRDEEDAKYHQNILILGLPNSGKTTVMQNLKFNLGPHHKNISRVEGNVLERTDQESRIFFRMAGKSFSVEESAEKYDHYDELTTHRSKNFDCVMVVVDCSTFYPIGNDSNSNISDSLGFFSEIVNDVHFTHRPKIILLNKHDIIRKKIAKRHHFLTDDRTTIRSPVSPAEVDEKEYEKVKVLIESQFLERIPSRKSRSGKCHIFFTDALDDNSLSDVMANYKIIMRIQMCGVC